jgi:intein/homing endonuclease
LAVEFNVPIVSATQTTRSGYCLSLDTKVFLNNEKKNITEVKIGDRIDTYAGQNIVKQIFPVIKKKAYKITLANGKTIVCSKEHLFPTKNGEKSIKNGLKIGECLQVKQL